MKAVTRDEFIALLHAGGSEEFRGLLARYDPDAVVGHGGFAVHEGDLASAGDWRLPAQNLLVLGAIACGGLVDLAPEGGSLWTLGGLRCRSYAGHPASFLIVDGDMFVAELAVAAFEDSVLLVTGDFTAHFFYGLDIWVNVGGRAVMDYGHGYALPLVYDDVAASVTMPRHGVAASLALLNLGSDEGAEELVVKMRRGEHFRAGG